ncbi:hypothetical protein LCGC14_2235630, partial [marine sediment metagenome]
GFGDLQTQDEGQSIIFDQAIAPITRNYDFTIRALGYKITEKLFDWELYGQVMKFEQGLRESAENDTQTFGFGILNNATGTSVSTGFDGLALASTAHTRLDGGATQANRPTSFGALSVSTLQTGLTQFKKWNNDRGRPIMSNPVILLVPPDLEFSALEILDSNLRADTANNTINVLNRFGLEVRVSRYLSSTTFWALIGDKHDMNLLWAKRPETGSETDFDTDTIKRKVRQGYARGHGEWIGYYQGNT